MEVKWRGQGFGDIKGRCRKGILMCWEQHMVGSQQARSWPALGKLCDIGLLRFLSGSVSPCSQ